MVVVESGRLGSWSGGISRCQLSTGGVPRKCSVMWSAAGDWPVMSAARDGEQIGEAA